VQEFGVRAAGGHPPVVEDDDLVDLVEAVEVVRDEQCRPAPGNRPPGPGCL
jgi:hypothetical protein